MELLDMMLDKMLGVDGWASDTNTWEPPEHLEACKGLVEQFERKLVRKAERRESVSFRSPWNSLT
jgi:hypothetical protein